MFFFLLNLLVIYNHIYVNVFVWISHHENFQTYRKVERVLQRIPIYPRIRFYNWQHFVKAALAHTYPVSHHQFI